MIPASAIPHLKTQIALFEPMLRIGLTAVRFASPVDLHLYNK
jgi:hypothetical protein